MQPSAHLLPNAATRAAMSVNELMHATLRLSDILAEESEHMDAMRYRELPKLNEEKMRLLSVLENYQRVMAADPNFIRAADERTREELLLRTDDLAFNVEENFRKVSVTRAVNSRVMQAMMDVMNDQQRPSTYGPKGVAASASDLGLSMNLNQRA